MVREGSVKGKDNSQAAHFHTGTDPPILLINPLNQPKNYFLKKLDLSPTTTIHIKNIAENDIRTCKSKA